MTRYEGEITTHKIFDAGFFPAEQLEQLELDNPLYFKNARMGISTKGIPRKIQLWSEKDGKLYIPRSIEVGVPLKDSRVRGKNVNFTFKGDLREAQIPAVADLTNSEGGILQAGCGTGKTVMSLASVAKVGTTTLVLVHKEFLLNQWVERIKTFLGEDAGIVRGDTWDYKGKKIVVAMLQTLYSRRDNIPEDFINYFGLVISDECLTYNSIVKTDVGDLPIGKIVEDKIKCNVLSYNEKTNTFEYKPITNWFNQGEKEVIRLTFDNGKTLECTYDHPILTRNRGWVPAGELTEEDDIVEG